MTSREYMEALSVLEQELDSAMESQDADKIQGTIMALEAFLDVVKVPEEDTLDAILEDWEAYDKAFHKSRS